MPLPGDAVAVAQAAESREKRGSRAGATGNLVARSVRVFSAEALLQAWTDRRFCGSLGALTMVRYVAAERTPVDNSAREAPASESADELVACGRDPSGFRAK